MANNEFRVVVGVDGSADARAAAEWAVREAIAHHGRLLVVHAWSLPAVIGGAGRLSPYPFETIEKSAQQLVAEEAGHLRELAPDLEVETRLEYGSPIEVLLEVATRTASWSGPEALGASSVSSSARSARRSSLGLHVPCWSSPRRPTSSRDQQGTWPQMDLVQLQPDDVERRVEANDG